MKDTKKHKKKHKKKLLKLIVKVKSGNKKLNDQVLHIAVKHNKYLDLLKFIAKM